MSRFTASGLDKKEQFYVYILEQTPKSCYICILFVLLGVIISSVILLVNIIVMSSITSISMLTLLHQIELEIKQKTRESILKHSIEAILPLIMY